MKISGEALSLARSGAGRGMEARGRVPSDSYGAIVRGPVGTLGRRRMRSGGNQSPLAGLWFGRFFVCPCGAALREPRLREGRLWEVKKRSRRGQWRIAGWAKGFKFGQCSEEVAHPQSLQETFTALLQSLSLVSEISWEYLRLPGRRRAVSILAHLHSGRISLCESA